VNPRFAALATTAAALAALAVAYFAQYRLHLPPCELCLWERWPYRITALLGLLALFAPTRATRTLLALATLAMAADIAIAFLHIGVEQTWWNSPLPECNGALAPGAPLPLFPATPCDRPVYLIPHLPLSMATMDFCAAAAFTIALAAYLLTTTRRTT
jgi:disulfide bond formation protein DsbB